MDAIKIQAVDIAKRYKKLVFKKFSYIFQGPGVYGIAGSNGIGKSTLLQILSGYLQQSHGKIEYWLGGAPISVLDFARKMSFVAPYTELIEELTVNEMFDFHSKHTAMTCHQNQFIEHIYMSKKQHAFVSELSSGMKQRLSLGLALSSLKPALFLDEPTSFLDEKAKGWFRDCLSESRTRSLVIIASNEKEELNLCDAVVDMGDFVQ